MKSRIVIPALFLASLLCLQSAHAQIKKLKNVSTQFSMSNDPNVDAAKFDIDLVSENPETKDMASAWGWRAVVYAAIAADTKYAGLDPKNEAAKIAGESYLKFYVFPESEQDKYDALTYANAYLPNCIVSCFNMGVNAGNTPGKFQEVKTYMELVDALLPYDKEEKAIGMSVSREKALLAIWRSAYADTLVEMEIIYLEKLIKIPTYYNADMFIRLSEIYTARKEYDKALAYLDKGKEKIPQKSSEFLDQQINIEIERNNITALLTKFNEAIEANPDNNAIYYFSRGVVFHQLKTTELKEQDKVIKSGGKPAPSKFYFSQGLSDYAKAVELDPGYFDAKNNEALLLNDSADYLYKYRNRLSGAEYDKYTGLAINLYKDVLIKLEWLRESGMKKDGELVELLKLMKSIAAKTGDEEKRIKYTNMYKEESKKLEGSGN